MGSGFKTFTAASVLTAADLNNYCQTQSVMYFATTAARDTAITSPVAGMVAFIDSGDANEGFYVYHGATGGWQKGPGWNAPWGVVAATAGGTSSRGIATTTSNSSTTSSAIDWSGLTVTFTAVTNRIYRTTAFGMLASDNAVGSDYAELSITNSSNTVIAASRAVVQSLVIEGRSVITVETGLTGSNMRKVRIVRASGTGNVSGSASATRQASIVVEDIGPSGAPA